MRIVLGWVGAAVVLLGAIIGGVAVAGATVFSASAFVRDYLGALSAGRVDDVLALPGVDADGLDPRLLDPLALTQFDWSIEGDDETAGVHTVIVAFSGAGTSGRTHLTVERVGTRFGLFPEWGFADSPVTALTLTTTGDTRVSVGRLPLDVADGGPVVFAALSPGVYTVAHDSEYLTADPVTVAATGSPASVAVAVEPDDAFVAAAQDAMEADLTACTTQQVLFPTGCPFGFAIQNRVAGVPEWTIARMPQATVAASDEIGLWAVP
ncbi:hypothetical protein FJ656_34245, partial [Schumannella luteola]